MLRTLTEADVRSSGEFQFGGAISFMYQPRICDIFLSDYNKKFEFEVVSGLNNIGMYIQQLVFNSVACKAGLRNGDRIIEINDTYVEYESSQSIQVKLNEAKLKNSLRLHVADTSAYKYYKRNSMDLSSSNSKRTPRVDRLRPVISKNSMSYMSHDS